MENTINERVKLLRNFLNMSQQNFATVIGSTTMTISRIEQSNTSPRSSTIERIVKEFKVNKEWILHGTGEMLLPAQKQLEKPSSEIVWKDEAYQVLKDEIKFLREMLKVAMGGDRKSFPNGIALAGIFGNEIPSNIVRA